MPETRFRNYSSLQEELGFGLWLFYCNWSHNLQNEHPADLKNSSNLHWEYKLIRKIFTKINKMKNSVTFPFWTFKIMQFKELVHKGSTRYCSSVINQSWLPSINRILSLHTKFLWILNCRSCFADITFYIKEYLPLFFGVKTLWTA